MYFRMADNDGIHFEAYSSYGNGNCYLIMFEDNAIPPLSRQALSSFWAYYTRSMTDQQNE